MVDEVHVLRRTDGCFVAKPGSGGSYTRNLANAKKYSSRESAIADSCPENERPEPLERLLDAYRS